MLVQALYQWQLSASDIGSIEAEFFADNTMTKVDTDYFRELLHAIPARMDELDERIAPCLDRRLDELDPVSLAVLRIGAYELLFRVDIPYRVSLNEAVTLARTFGPTEAHKYINGVLDKLAAGCRQAEIRSFRE